VNDERASQVSPLQDAARARAATRSIITEAAGGRLPKAIREVVEVEVMRSPPPGDVPTPTEHVTIDELKSIHARNVRDSESPGHRESLRIMSALLFGPIMIRERRAAEAVELAPPAERVNASQSRSKVLEILGRSKAAE
jgi:hypothetical protein